jgi:hypothetical protein
MADWVRRCHDMHGADMHVRKTCVILGPPVDQSFRDSMIDLSKDWTVYFVRSIAGTWPAKRELPSAA